MAARFGAASPFDHYVIKIRWLVGSLAAMILLLLGLLILISTDQKEPAAMAKAAAPDNKPMEPVIDLAVPRFRIEASQQIEASMFKAVSFSVNDTPEDAVRFKDLSSVAGQYAVNTIYPGSALLTQMLQPGKGFAGLHIPPGMRATTIAVSAEDGVEWWVQPNSRVDVLFNYRDPSGHPAVRTLMYFKRVLSVAGNSTPDGSTKGSSGTKTVTLLVSEEETRVLTLASSHGKLSLVLRGDNDSGEMPQRLESTTLHTILGHQAPASVEEAYREGELQYQLPDGRYRICRLQQSRWKCRVE